MLRAKRHGGDVGTFKCFSNGHKERDIQFFTTGAMQFFLLISHAYLCLIFGWIDRQDILHLSAVLLPSHGSNA